MVFLLIEGRRVFFHENFCHLFKIRIEKILGISFCFYCIFSNNFANFLGKFLANFQYQKNEKQETLVAIDQIINKIITTQFKELNVNHQIGCLQINVICHVKIIGNSLF
jgi:hypothetical protein